MNALIAHIAAAEIPEPVPVVVDEVLVVGLKRSRTKPDIEIKVLRRTFYWLEANAPSRLTTIALGDKQLAVFAALDSGNLVRPAITGAALRAVLNNSLVLASGVNTLAPLKDIMAARLLNIDILARLAGPNSNQRVRVIGRSDGNSINALVFQQFTNIDIGINLFVAVLK